MIGKECTYKNTWIKGRINRALGDSYGVYWYGGKEGYHKQISRPPSKWIGFIDNFRRTKHNVSGVLHFWQNKEDIKVK